MKNGRECVTIRGVRSEVTAYLEDYYDEGIVVEQNSDKIYSVQFNAEIIEKAKEL